jgi:glucokinase
MTPAPGVLIGVDVGNTTMSGGLVAPDGAVLSVVETSTHRDGPGTALDTLLGTIGELVSWAEARGVKVEGIGVGLPGIVDVDAGTLGTGIGQLPELAERPLVELIRAKTGIDAFVDNDVNALALGEWRYGLARGATSLVVLALGTGLGGAVILDGRLVRGRSGYAGEFGHVPVKFDGRRCPCGARGCLGAYAAGYGIAMEYRRRVQGHRRPVKRGSPPPSEANAEEVFATSAAGDARARAVIDEACRALGAALAVIVNGLNPEVIVVTGGVVTSLAALEHEIVQHTAEHAFDEPLAATRIHFVPGLKSQTLRGGAALVLYERARRAAGRSAPCSHAAGKSPRIGGVGPGSTAVGAG